MGIDRGLLARSFDVSCPTRRRDFRFNFIDDAGRAAAEPVACDLGDILIGVPEPDSSNTTHVFVVDRVYLQVAAAGGEASGDLVQVDVFAGPAGTTMLTTEPVLKFGCAAADLAYVGGTATSVIIHPVLKAASLCEVPAGTGIYIDLTVVNAGASVTGFGCVNIIVSGYFKNEF